MWSSERKYLCKRGNRGFVVPRKKSPARCGPATHSRLLAIQWDCCCYSSWDCCLAGLVVTASLRVESRALGLASMSSMARTFAFAVIPTFCHIGSWHSGRRCWCIWWYTVFRICSAKDGAPRAPFRARGLRAPATLSRTRGDSSGSADSTEDRFSESFYNLRLIGGGRDLINDSSSNDDNGATNSLATTTGAVVAAARRQCPTRLVICNVLLLPRHARHVIARPGWSLVQR